MYRKDLEIITDFHMLAGHSDASIKSYNTAFNKYRDFHNMSLKQLLNEAINEQEKQVPSSQLKLFDRLNSFKQHLVENHIGNTIASTLTKIKTFYKYNRVDVPFIPPVNTKIINQNECISYEDLLTKEEIRKALNLADKDMKAWILVMASSGASRCEAKSMTNEMFCNGTYSYHKKSTIEDAFNHLANADNVVCTCKLKRKKTNKPYYTFLNPETVQYIAKLKIKQGDFNPQNPLLKHDVNYINHKCSIINDALSLGYAGGYRRFRPHMLRKFNATYLNQVGDDLLDMDVVDCLHGRSKGATRDAYFKSNPDYLKLEYIRCMSNVSLFHTYSYEVVEDELQVFSHDL